MLWVGLPVLNLQERLKVLEMDFGNGTLAAEDKPFFSLQLGYPKTGGPGLQVLQAQLIQVRTSQEQLLQQVNNLTRNPGTTTLFLWCWASNPGFLCMLSEQVPK